MRRRIALVAVAAAALVLLSGCVTIPTGGGVTTQRISQNQGGDDTIRAVSGPTQNATPSEIVAGFVRAGGGPQSQYQVAKEYLATSLVSKWKPAAGTLISDSQVTPFATDGPADGSASFTVALSVTGQIDASGVYTPQSSAERPLSFHVVKEKGQWRIDKAPDLTVLRTRDLGLVAKAYDLYFFDPGYDYLVPDLRWFADQGGGYILGRIVSAVLAGPSKYLTSPVVVSAFTDGTQIGTAPSLDAGTVTVDFSSGVLSATAQQQGRMLQQLTSSLSSFDVSSVKMTANGIAVPVSDASSANAAPGVPYSAIGSDGKAFGAVTASAVAPLPAIGEAVQALAPTAVALGRDRTTAAVLGAGGVSLVAANGHPLVDARPGLLAPTLDPEGYVWSTQADPGSLVVVRSDGRAHPMPVTASGQVVSIATSRDGTRLLVALATDTGAQLMVLGIQRDKDGAPTGFGAPLELPVDPGRPLIDAAWVDSGSVAIIAGDADGSDRVSQLTLGGQSIDYGTVSAGRKIAAGDGSSFETAVRVLLATGELDKPSVGEWESTGPKLSFLGTQQ